MELKPPTFCHGFGQPFPLDRGCFGSPYVSVLGSPYSPVFVVCKVFKRRLHGGRFGIRMLEQVGEVLYYVIDRNSP